MVQVIVPLLVPVVTGIVGAVGLMLKDRRLARDSRNIRTQALAQATAEVGFASEWWKAQQLLGADGGSEPARKLNAWLAEAEAIVTEAEHVPIRHNRVTFRRLFLLEPMHRRSSKILKVLFWVSVVWLVAVAIVTASDIAHNHEHRWVSGDVALMVISAVIVLLLHVWAESSEQHATTPAPDLSPSQQASAVGVARH